MAESFAQKRSSLVYWIVLVTTVLTLTLLLYSSTFKNLVDQATNWSKVVMNAHPVTGAAVFFLFAALSAMLAFTSSAVLVAPANLVWGKLITFLLLWGGWIAGAVVAFGIGSVARPLLIRFGYQRKLNEYQQLVSRRMKFWTAVLFCIAVPSEIPGYLLGGLRYPFWKFLGAIAIAESIYAFGVVIAGQSLLKARPLTLLFIISALLIIGIVARRSLRSIRSEPKRANND